MGAHLADERALYDPVPGLVAGPVPRVQPVPRLGPHDRTVHRGVFVCRVRDTPGGGVLHREPVAVYPRTAPPTRPVGLGRPGVQDMVTAQRDQDLPTRWQTLGQLER
jgi:hypothetical protein